MNKHLSLLIESSDLFALVTPPSFALSVFHMKERTTDNGATLSSNTLTRRLFERISTRKDIMLTQTNLNGVFCIRFAIGAARTETRHVDDAFKLLRDEALQTLPEVAAGK